MTDNSILSRRLAFGRIGAITLAAFAVPTLLTTSKAFADDSEGSDSDSDSGSDDTESDNETDDENDDEDDDDAGAVIAPSASAVSADGKPILKKKKKKK